jgi:diguanylate cyclase (GGDEF)-like protein
MTWTDSPFTPLVVLIEGQEWTARSLESILSPHGCAVFRAYTGHQGLDILKRLIPDLILVDRHLPDMTAPQVFRRLGDLPTVGASTPKCLISTSPVSREDRLAAFQGGAWEVLTPPFDSAELTIRLNTWVSAKREVDAAREQGMLDPLTGLYNLKGLLRRIDELVSDASRNERHISLLAVGLPQGKTPEEEMDPDELTRLVGLALGKTTRLSDAVARVGPAEFIIVAPGTDSSGAEVLADRLLALAKTEELPLRAGIFSARRAKREPIAPLDLLNRATEALRRAQSAEDGPPIFSQESMN